MPHKSREFSEEYFKNYLKYEKKKLATQYFYLDVLKWADKYSTSMLLDGKGKRALDVGCAYGYGLRLLYSLGYTVYGIDVSEYAIEKAKKFIGEGATLIVHDVQKPLPLKDKFDLITCFEVIEHLQDYVSAIMHMYQALKPGGVLLMTTPNKLTASVVKYLLDGPDPTHINEKHVFQWSKLIHSMFGNIANIRVECRTGIPKILWPKLRRYMTFKVPCFGLGVRIFIERPKNEK